MEIEKYKGRKVTEIETVKDLKKYLKKLPDDMFIMCGNISEKVKGGCISDLHACIQSGYHRDDPKELLFFPNRKYQ